MITSDEGSITEVRDGQSLNVPPRSAVTPFGTTIDLNAAASSKVLAIRSKPEGRVADTKPVQVLKVLVSVVTPLGMTIDVIALQPVIAKAPILVTPEGRIKDVRIVQPANARSPMVWSPEGRIKDVREMQYAIP